MICTIIQLVELEGRLPIVFQALLFTVSEIKSMKKRISQVGSRHVEDYRGDELDVSIRSKGFFKFLGETLVVIVLLQGLPVGVVNQNPSINPLPKPNAELSGRT